METLKLSIIVPVYNVAPYLRKCVDSLLMQDYDDYEIILVDDGSTDDSWQIIQEYDSRFRGLEDERIRGIHQENGGLSAARNTGIKAAKGEYICFVDSDDYWEENVLGSLMEQVERENLDVLRFDYQNVCVTDGVQSKEDGIKYRVFEPNKTSRYIDKYCEIVDGETYLNTRMGYACYAVMYIMHRDIVPIFTEGLHYEDTEWMPRMMLAAKRVNSTPRMVYNYFWREGSITLTHGDVIKVRTNVEDNMTIIEQYNRYIEQNPDCQWLKQMRSSMVVSVLTKVARHLYPESKEFIKRLRDMNVFPLTKETKQGKTYLRKARLINISPRLTVELLHLKNG